MFKKQQLSRIIFPEQVIKKMIGKEERGAGLTSSLENFLDYLALDAGLASDIMELMNLKEEAFARYNEFETQKPEKRQDNPKIERYLQLFQNFEAEMADIRNKMGSQENIDSIYNNLEIYIQNILTHSQDVFGQDEKEMLDKMMRHFEQEFSKEMKEEQEQEINREFKGDEKFN